MKEALAFAYYMLMAVAGTWIIYDVVSLSKSVPLPYDLNMLAPGFVAYALAAIWEEL